jgi:hypothetical protein
VFYILVWRRGKKLPAAELWCFSTDISLLYCEERPHTPTYTEFSDRTNRLSGKAVVNFNNGFSQFSRVHVRDISSDNIPSGEMQRKKA